MLKKSHGMYLKGVSKPNGSHTALTRGGATCARRRGRAEFTAELGECFRRPMRAQFFFVCVVIRLQKLLCATEDIPSNELSVHQRYYTCEKMLSTQSGNLRDHVPVLGAFTQFGCELRSPPSPRTSRATSRQCGV